LVFFEFVTDTGVKATSPSVDARPGERAGRERPMDTVTSLDPLLQHVTAYG
jgi:hypothetical protein